MHNKKIAIGIIGTLIVSMAIVGCQKSETQKLKENQSQSPQTEVAGEAYEAFKLKNDYKGDPRELEFSEVPKRAISLNQSTTEILLTLGLEKQMIGTSYLDEEILPNLKEAYESVEVIAKEYPSVEQIVAKNPDFLIGWPSAFTDSYITSYEYWDNKGINAYVPNSSLANGEQTLEMVYQDILDIGKIFNVSDKADKVVNEMKTTVNNVKEKTDKVDKKVEIALIHGFKEGKISTRSSKGLQNNLITLAGGVNVFPDSEGGELSAEKLVEKNPQMLVINSYMGNKGSDAIIKSLKEDPVLSKLDAVKNNKFVICQLSDVQVGVRNANAVENMAKGFYPELFK